MNQRKLEMASQVCKFASDIKNDLVLCDFAQKSANEIAAIRKSARKVGVKIFITKNRIAKKAFLQSNWPDQLINQFHKHNMMLFGNIFKSMSLTGRALIPKVISNNSSTITDPKMMKKIAGMKTKEGAIGNFMATLQTPIAKFIQLLILIKDGKVH